MFVEECGEDCLVWGDVVCVVELNETTTISLVALGWEGGAECGLAAAVKANGLDVHACVVKRVVHLFPAHKQGISQMRIGEQLGP